VNLLAKFFLHLAHVKFCDPPGNWRHNIGSVKLEKILKFSVSVIFRDSSSPANFFFCGNLHKCNSKVPRDCNGSFRFRLQVKLCFFPIFENLRMLIVLSFCNLERYSGSGIFPNITGKCYINARHCKVPGELQTLPSLNKK
jgi:hypothetical protein